MSVNRWIKAGFLGIATGVALAAPPVNADVIVFSDKAEGQTAGSTPTALVGTGSPTWSFITNPNGNGPGLPSTFQYINSTDSNPAAQTPNQ